MRIFLRLTFFGLMLVVLFQVAVVNAAPAQVELSISFDKAWMKIAQVLALENVTITTSDKQTGIIQGSGSFAGKSEFFMCDKGRGILDKEEYSLTIVVTPNSSGRVKIQIQTTGKTTWYQYHRILFIKIGRAFNYITCESTGKLEELIFQRLREESK